MTAHPHANLMLLYALDAHETDAPWLRWQWRSTENAWQRIDGIPMWHKFLEYRRDPALPLPSMEPLRKLIVETGSPLSWLTPAPDTRRRERFEAAKECLRGAAVETSRSPEYLADRALATADALLARLEGGQ